jgi:hypothetical protein
MGQATRGCDIGRLVEDVPVPATVFPEAAFEEAVGEFMPPSSLTLESERQGGVDRKAF